MIPSRILGTGHFTPENVVTNFDLEKMMDTNDEFIVTRTGVRERRHAAAETSASDLGAKAAQAAIADAGLTPDQIDLLIMNTITPDHHDPGCGFFLQAKLDMPGIPVLDIKAQCAGLIYGISIADHFIQAGTYRNVLIVCSEVLSKRIDCSNDGRNIGILLGDGAGAAVVGPSDDEQASIVSTILHADGTHAKALYTAAPGTGQGKMDFVDQSDVDEGRVHFRMDGRTVYENGVAGMASAANESLEANGLTLDDIDILIPHQANMRMLEAVVEKIGIELEKVFINVENYGNMASACLPIALDQARKAGRANPGDTVLLVAFGSGFVWASALLRM